MRQPHLYRRGAVYYWRRTFPTVPHSAPADPAGARRPIPDLKVSLRTPDPAVARHRAAHLDLKLDRLMRDSHPRMSVSIR